MTYGVLFNRKNGNIIKTMTSEWTPSMLKMWALQGNVSKTRDYVVFGDDGIITFYCEGRGKNDMPKIHKDMEGTHIDELSEGLLEALTA